MPLKEDWHRRLLSSILRPNEGYDIAWLLHGESNTGILMPYHGFNCMGNISRVSWWKKGIGHFQITFGLFFQASPRAYPFIWKLVFIHLKKKNNFHIKGQAPDLALKKRPKLIRKWLINAGILFSVRTLGNQMIIHLPEDLLRSQKMEREL